MLESISKYPAQSISVNVIFSLAETGILVLTSFIGFDIDGEYMCAAVSEDKVCELCAPPHMFGKAAKRAANSNGKILMLDNVPIGAEVAVMAYNAVDFSYFNLFLD